MMSSYRDLSGDEVTRLAVLAPSLEGSESPICVQDGFWIAPASIRCREPILKVSVLGLYGSAAPPPTRFLFRRKHYARRPRRIAALTPERSLWNGRTERRCGAKHRQRAQALRFGAIYEGFRVRESKRAALFRSTAASPKHFDSGQRQCSSARAGRL